ncbi:hypothetical protein FB479_11666 [Brevibacillus sp. AG162]|uniref:hypothetical protein n=1 Tax=Brevibacillus sp. AG162 TaxID=2572910 RepID=UPI001151C3BD|nr:hypothetical protein [Brevibacillus sp. AG162]TQK41965.1 hypothetical protein FB479_11666 [Brevibacillus sp. AG162]
MPKHFQFKRLIDRFGIQLTILEPTEGSTGYGPNGKKINQSPTSKVVIGVLTPLSKDEIRHAPNGTYSVHDRNLYTLEPVKPKSQVEHEGKRYTVLEIEDYTAYTDVYMYLAKGAG